MGSEFVGHTEVYDFTSHHKAVPRDRRDRIGLRVITRHVVEHPGAEGAVSPREAEVTRHRNETRDLAITQIDIPAKVPVGVEQRVVGVETQLLQQSRQELERLHVAKLPALNERGAGIGRRQQREAIVVTIVAVVHARPDGA